MNTMLKALILPFLILSGIGLFLCLLIHMAALLRVPFEHYNKVFFLAVGVFIVWLPTILVATRLTKDFKQKDFLKAALRGCPVWLKYFVYVMFGYAAFNFIYMIISGDPSENPTTTARFISGHLLIFYSAALATLYSAIQVDKFDTARRCMNGHPVSPSAKFCEECGAPVKNNL